MIRVAASNSPVEVAWAAYDAAELRRLRLYQQLDVAADTPLARHARMKAAEESARLHEEWRKLFLSDNDPRPAA